MIEIKQSENEINLPVIDNDIEREEKEQNLILDNYFGDKDWGVNL